MKSRVSRALRMVIEELEPRILYSADAAAFLHPGALAHSAEVRLLATYAASSDSTSLDHAVADAANSASVQAQRREIVFVDTSVSGYEQLLADLHNDPTRRVDTVLLDNRTDGIDQISQELSQRRDISGIHIISHGNDGAIQLGAGTLDAASLRDHAAQIGGWSRALTADADILIYGCDVAADAQGQSLIEALGRLTGADVAASVDLTGSAARGGDWDLEYRTGGIESSLAIGEAAQRVWVGTLANLAPVTTVPGAESTNEDTVRVFSSGNGNQISITDVDAGGANNEVTLSVTNGTLTLAGITGLSFSSGDGTADAVMTLRGTAGAINTALDGLSYSPTADYNGSATLTLATTDSVLLSLNIDASLLGRYAFENTGALGTDTSPAAGNAGVPSGAAAVNDGTRGNVLGLAGAGGIQVAGHYGNPADVTLAAWVNLISADSSGAEVISLGDSAGLRLDSPGGVLQGFFYDGTLWVQANFNTVLAGTGWRHVGFTFDDAADTATLYLDGVAVSTTGTAASINYTLGADTFIGTHGNGVGTYDFNGSIDEARIFNRALTADEIATLASDLTMIDTGNVAVTVVAVNDAPGATNLSAAEAYTEDTALNLTDIVVSDIDSANVTATLTLSDVAAGSLNTGTAGAVTSTYIAATGVWSASGAVADVNTLLAGLTFTPAVNYNSNFTIATSVSDGVAAPVTGTKAMTGTAVNDAPTVTDRALSFDGTDVVVVAAQPNLVMTSTLTMEAMIQRTGPLGANQIIVNKEGEYEFAVSATGKLQWAFASTTPGWVWVETSFTVPADTWVHVAVTYNSGVVKAYVDGALVDTYNGTGNIGDVSPAMNDLTLGGRQNTPLQRFSGLIDEVRVWNVERTGAEIQAAYNTALAGNEAGLVGYWRFNETAGTTAVDSSTQGYNGVLGNGVPADVPTRTINLDYTTAEDNALVVAASGVLTGATDPDGSVPTATLVSGPANAAAFTLNPNGSFSYTPVANFNGIDSFVFTAGDGSLNSQQATVYLNVTAVNDAPTATNLNAAETYSAGTPRNLTDIVVGDIDSANVTATLTLSNAAAGSLNTGTSGAVTSTYSAGTGVWSASGALADVNTLLAALTFTPAVGFNANFTIATSVSDGVAAPVTGNKAVTFNETISGTIFEDVNYGGGAGRDRLAAGGVGLAGARVELYDAAGNFLAATTTSATGAFTLDAPAGNYFLRVVNDTVVSSRSGYVAGLLPVQTFRVDASTGAAVGLTDHVGGENPTEIDAAANLTNQTLAVLNAAAGREIQSVTAMTLGAGGISGVDFGFNFDTIVSTRDAGQGSLRQFILNANALGNAGLSQVGQTAGREVSLFMISDGAAHAGLRAGLTNQLATSGGNSGAAVITLVSSLPAITDASTSIDGRTQTSYVGNTNAGTVGTGGTVGVDALVLDTVARPEVAVNAAGVDQAFLIDDLNVSVSDMAVYGVVRSGGPTGVQVRVSASATAAGPATITRMLIGTLADGTDPGAGFRGDFGGRTEGATTVSNNFIAYLDWDGFSLSNLGGGPERVVFTDNEVSFSGFLHASGDLLTDIGNNATVRGNLFHDTRYAGTAQSYNGKGIELWFNASNNLIENNTIFNAQTAGIGINTNAVDNVIRRNVITGTLGSGAANTGAGILVTGVSGTPLRNLLTENSIYGNAGLAIDIDLRTTAATALGNGVTANDGTINNARPNAEMDAPVFTKALLSGTTLSVSGYVGNLSGQSTFANARVEIFRAQVDASGFGEGQTFLGSLTTDASGNFSGTLTVSGLAVGDRLTASASNSTNNTSEFGANQIVSAGTIPVASNESYSVDQNGSLTVNWWDASWAHREQITFSGNTFVGAQALANYPVLITLNSSNIDYAQTQNNGADLRFFDADGTPLAYEIERWDETGNSYVWVKVPQIDTSGTDSITMYYGNAAAAAGQDATAVWSGNGYQAVYHLAETSGATTVDASANAFSGTLTNGVLPGAGQIGGAQSFDGVNDFINLGANRAFINGVSQLTVSALINPTTVAGTFDVMAVSINNGGAPTTNSRAGFNIVNGQIQVLARGPDAQATARTETTTATVAAGTWSRVDGVIDFAANTIKVYINGVLQASVSAGPALTAPTADNTNSASATLGSEDNGGSAFYSGLMDEARMSATARSAAWIKADYLASTNAFVTMGASQSAAGAGGVLANDTDAGGDRLRAVLVGGPANGSLTLNADGTFAYTPNANFSGTDSFTYKVNDGSFDSNVATVTITVNPVVVAPVVVPPVIAPTLLPPPPDPAPPSNSDPTAGGVSSLPGAKPAANPDAGFSPAAPAIIGATSTAEALLAEATLLSEGSGQGETESPSQARAASSTRNRASSPSAAVSMAGDILRLMENEASADELRSVLFARELPSGIRTAPSGRGSRPEELQDESTPDILTLANGVRLTGVVLSAGAVTWALQGAGLLASLLSSVPAWRHLDPLPVLAPDEEKPIWRDDKDKESQHEEDATSAIWDDARRDGGGAPR